MVVQEWHSSLHGHIRYFISCLRWHLLASTRAVPLKFWLIMGRECGSHFQLPKLPTQKGRFSCWAFTAPQLFHVVWQPAYTVSVLFAHGNWGGVERSIYFLSARWARLSRDKIFIYANWKLNAEDVEESHLCGPGSILWASLRLLSAPVKGMFEQIKMEDVVESAVAYSL